ncbi:stealth conserved region 3 domain-containing protein [Kitasatospora sp. NPDC002227]|uniref:stealth conserved region 3 domain-containing protein n=1 Tax=Kitasatospora sp. NPDC002227 TaxID=3154773 RepID=UPI0033297EB5
MKITFLLTTADAMGGTERAVLTVAEALAELHEVEVLSVFRTRSSSFFSAKVPVRYLVDNTGPVPRPARGGEQDDPVYRAVAARPSELVDPAWEKAFNRLSDLEAERWFRTTDSDVVVSSTPALQALMVRLAPPSVVTVGQEHRVSELRGVSGAPLIEFTPHLDAMVALSEPTRSWFAETFTGFAPRLEVIGNALPDVYRPTSSLETRTITMAGRMVAEKQADHAITAFAKVAGANPLWKLRLLGDGPLLRRMRELAANLGIADQVQLAGSTGHMPEEWAQASICLLTSRVEAFGLVLAEAQAAGVPIVSYASPNGPAEIVTDGADGLLVPPGDIDGLAEALRRLMTEQDTRQAFGAAALAASERWSAPVIAERWSTVLTELVTARDNGSLTAGRERRRLLHEYSLTELGVVAAEASTTSSATVRIDQRAHEVRIEAQSGGRVIRGGGLLCQVSDDRTPFDVMQDNLGLVVDVLEQAGIPYLLTRTNLLRHSLAVDVEYREKLLTALAERYHDDPVYLALFDARGSVVKNALAAVLDQHLTDFGAVHGVRVFRPVSTTAGTLRLTGVYGCSVSFLTPVEEHPGLLAVAEDTVYGPTLPKSMLARTATRRIGERDHPTLEAFTKRLPNDVDFPVDAVYTWVDGNDPAWKARRNKVLTERGLAPAQTDGDGASDDARFRDREELRYSLRSLDMFAPWIRTVYLVTDDQTPAWLDTDHPRVKVVSHRELFGDTGTLPSFNSHAIESRLHRIEGLSEHFLYLNDDVFFGRTLRPENFFLGSGQAKCFPSPTKVDPAPVQDGEEFALIAAKNNRALLEREFGRTPTNTFVHSPHALRRSTLEELEARFPAEVARTADAQLRSATDLAIASSLQHYFGMFTGRTVADTISCGFVNVGLRSHHPRLAKLLSARPNDVFCINDYHDADVSAEEQADVLAVFLPSYFPVPSQFEKGSVRNARLAR